jgi:hypothetical protein
VLESNADVGKRVPGDNMCALVPARATFIGDVAGTKNVALRPMPQLPAGHSCISAT